MTDAPTPRLVNVAHQHHDHATDEAAFVRMAVATNMHRVRLARGMSLRDMAAHTGLSTALLSQIEREVGNPTVAALTRIAHALELTFSELTRPVVTEPEIVRARDADATGARLLFSMMERRRFDLSEGVLTPGQAGVFSDHGRGSIEYGYVVSGSVTLTIENVDHVLEAGDVVRFSAALPHAYQAGDGSACLLTVVAYGDE